MLLVKNAYRMNLHRIYSSTIDYEQKYQVDASSQYLTKLCPLQSIASKYKHHKSQLSFLWCIQYIEKSGAVSIQDIILV